MQFLTLIRYSILQMELFIFGSRRPYSDKASYKTAFVSFLFFMQI
jgi:hypothetical protein